MIFSNLFSRYDSRNLNRQNGITLVALVVTIVVLLILAGITITMLFGENGIIKKAQDAADATKNAQDDTVNGLANLENAMNQALGENGGAEVTIPEGLEVGSTVSYNPSGTYNWQAKYCSSTKTETTADVTLSSAEGQNFNISSWKVLSIDETTKNVTLVPSNPTTGTVYLGQAQGYSNVVKLLNDACSSLYGNTDKGITARSINIKDIEDYMLPDKLEEAHAYINTNSNTTYGHQVGSAYTSTKIYPVIYAYEKQSVINADPGKEKTLDLSDTPENFIERTTDSATSGKLTASTSIQPYQTYWYKDATYMSTAFKPFDDTNVDKGNYASLILPKGKSTTYWVASRCIDANSGNCFFGVRIVYSGAMYAYSLYGANNYTSDYSGELFPVITLSSKLIEGNATSGFSVK